MKDIFLGYCSKCCIVYAMMVIETFILCINKSLPENRVHFFILHRGTVFTKILAYHHVICAIELGGL